MNEERHNDSRWPKVVVHCQTDVAVDLLQRYYAQDDSGKPRYTGARFEAMAALNDDPHTLGPADFVAVSMLSVNVPPEAAIRLLGPDAAIISSLLKQVPSDQDIVDVQPRLLATESPAGKLWAVLRGGKDGLGRTTTSKLLAAKRPRLIPIWDSFVEHATGFDTRDYWRRFQEVLNADDRYIWKWLSELQSLASNVPATVRELRILDVLFWMSVEGGLKGQAGGGG
ncbi:DUF6308 family protein [Mycobacterium sp. B14F4]|uniref:DUF6308 family protein n=1 Tax=Mycobacterium sp. B14F4 TaxID=3153565 RepID=UPI00325CE20F